MEQGASLIRICFLVLALAAFVSSEAREEHGHQSNGHHHVKYSPVSAPQLTPKSALAPTSAGPVPAPAPAPAGPIDPITYTSYFFFPAPAPAPSAITAPTGPASAPAPAGPIPNDGIPLIPSYAPPQLPPSMSPLESLSPSPTAGDIEPLPYPYVAAPPPDPPGFTPPEFMPPHGSWKCGEGPCWDSEYCDYPCSVCKGGVCSPDDYSYDYSWMFAPSYPMTP